MPPFVRPRQRLEAPRNWRAGIKEGAIPIISDVEGFMAYYVVYAGDDTVTAISIFNKYEQAEEANRRALAWIAENVEPLLVGDAKAVAGPVIVHTRA